MEARHGPGTARRIPPQARLPEDRRTQRRHRRRARAARAVRDPEARRHPPALRLPAGGRRGAEVVGGDQGPVAGSGRQAAVGRGRGPPAGLWRLRGHDPQGPVRRRHGAAVGPRLLVARTGLRGRGQGPEEGRAEVRAGRRAAAWLVGAGADELGPQRQGWKGQAVQLAADQAQGRGGAAGRGDGGAGGGRLDRLGPDHGRHRRRQGQGAVAVHPEGQGQGRRGVDIADQGRARGAAEGGAGDADVRRASIGVIPDEREARRSGTDA
jgi:hypothetical protein